MTSRIFSILYLLSTLLYSNLIFSDNTVVDNSTKNQIVFLHFNDFYDIQGRYGKGGLAALYQAIKKQKNRYPNALLSFGGDLFSPSLYSSFSHGKHMLDALNILQVDAAVPGNHEFDFGLVNAQAQFAGSNFPWIISNLKKTNGDLLRHSQETFIAEVNGLKIGFFGLITPQLVFLSQAQANIKIEDIISIARQKVIEFKSKSVDIIVALTHLNLEQDKRLAKQVKGIDLIMGGHDHYPVSVLINNTLIFKAGFNGQYLGLVKLDFNKLKKSPYAVSYNWQFISTEANSRTLESLVPSSEISQYLKSYSLQLNSEKDKILAKTTILLDAKARQLRSAESNFASLVADAIKQYYKTDLALINGGAIRSDKIYPANSTLTNHDVLAALPFANRAVVVQLTGKKLLEILEHGVSAIEEYAGRFPQIAGFSFEFSKLKAPGQRVTKVIINNNKLDLQKNYSIATADYLYAGGDGYQQFKQSKVVVDSEQGLLISTIVADYLSNLEVVKSIKTDRIIELEK
ncbi:MAG: 5'-nucleotidase C-terminal domain-containing protein [Pseudomonadota bacterium]